MRIKYLEMIIERMRPPQSKRQTQCVIKTRTARALQNRFHTTATSSTRTVVILAIVSIINILFLNSVLARPVVRNIRSTHEFDRLLEKHATETGLPVVVDFYSDHCGPCRMMAPIFKKVAEDFVDKAVFVKIDTNSQAELSSRYQVRSLPTFQFFVDGKKFDEAVGGIGEGPLRQQTNKAIRDAELTNVNLSIDALIEYYKTHDATKSDVDVTKVHTKCIEMVGKKFNPNKECIGDAANKLARQLKKKYGKAPGLVPRFTAESRKSTNNNTEKKEEEKPATPNNRRASGSSVKPNLHLASLDELKAEIEKRLDEERDKEVENEVDDDVNELDPDFAHAKWTKSDFPERMIIIGAGPAGLSAAIYGARAGLAPLVIAPSMGGQLQGKGVDVENYPGLNTTGPAVVALMKRQAAHFGAVFEDDIVANIIVPSNSSSKSPIQVVTNSSGIIETHTVIVATGAESNWLGITGEWELRGGGVSSCATCDGFLYSDRHVIVVGGGDTAMEDALVLARTSKKVTIIHRRDTFRASKVLANRVLDYHDPTKIQVVWNSIVTEIIGKTDDPKSTNTDEDVVDMDQVSSLKKVVSGVKLQDVVSGEISTIPCDAVFVAIGHTPNTQFVNGVVEFNPNHPGYISIKNGSTRTSVPGIFAAGDVADATYRQAITSAGSGAEAALDAERYLSEHGLGNEAAEFEAELLAELLTSDSEKRDNMDDTQRNNIYDEVGSSIKGMKESLASAGEL